jgi:hypothetical protein
MYPRIILVRSEKQGKGVAVVRMVSVPLGANGREKHDSIIIYPRIWSAQSLRYRSKWVLKLDDYGFPPRLGRLWQKLAVKGGSFKLRSEVEKVSILEP